MRLLLDKLDKNPQAKKLNWLVSKLFIFYKIFVSEQSCEYYNYRKRKLFLWSKL